MVKRQRNITSSLPNLTVYTSVCHCLSVRLSVCLPASLSVCMCGYDWVVNRLSACRVNKCLVFSQRRQPFNYLSIIDATFAAARYTHSRYTRVHPVHSPQHIGTSLAHSHLQHVSLLLNLSIFIGKTISATLHFGSLELVYRITYSSDWPVITYRWILTEQPRNLAYTSCISPC